MMLGYRPVLCLSLREEAFAHAVQVLGTMLFDAQEGRLRYKSYLGNPDPCTGS